MTGYALELVGVSRTFDRSGKTFTAVDNVGLTIQSGDTLALLGPNGAGKTTLIKMVATLLEPTGGAITVDGFDTKTDERIVRSRLGLVLGGDRGFYLRATVQENLEYFASLSRVARRHRRRMIDEVLQAVSLQDRRRQAVETLSRGLKQRLHIARGLLSNPSLLLLDEPTIGLDPEAALALRELIRSLKSQGRSILLTTHYLFEAESLADDVAVIIDGRITARGSVAEIARAGGIGSVTALTMTHLPPEMAVMLEGLAGVRNVASEQVGGQRQVIVAWEPGAHNEQALRAVIESSSPSSVVTRPATLEESYLALVAKQADKVEMRRD